MRPNREPGTCSVCHVAVDVEAGFWLGRRETGRVVCVEHRPVPPARGDHDGWHLGPLASLDVETTGVDPWTDRIISYAALGDRGAALTGLINPGIEVPHSSAEVHGLTDAMLASAPASRVGLVAVLQWVQGLIERGIPLVVFNAPYDLTLLRVEADRWELAQPDWDRLIVIDPHVIDWGIEGDALGTRRLVDIAPFYGVAIEDAHDAACDAEAARGVAIEMGARQPELAAWSMPVLMQHQRRWFAERVESFSLYSEESGRTPDDPHGWPFGISAAPATHA